LSQISLANKSPSSNHLEPPIFCNTSRWINLRSAFFNVS